MSSLDAIGTNRILFLNEARIHSFHSSMLLIVYCVITAYHLVCILLLQVCSCGVKKVDFDRQCFGPTVQLETYMLEIAKISGIFKEGQDDF